MAFPRYGAGLEAKPLPITFTSDLKGLNKAAIQHDLRKLIEFGFGDALLVADIAFSTDEYVQFAQWAHEAADGKLRIVHHASFNTLEENIAVTRRVTSGRPDPVYAAG